MKLLRIIGIILFCVSMAAKSHAQLTPDSIRFKPVISLQPLKSSYYCNKLGFFCRQEVKLDKLTAMPIRFRLGSLNYVNYLEQKPNARVKPF
jgi:hypothetical protein